jgi:hypothetical protein
MVHTPSLWSVSIITQLWKGTRMIVGMNVDQKHVKWIYVATLTLEVCMSTYADW